MSDLMPLRARFQSALARHLPRYGDKLALAKKLAVRQSTITAYLNGTRFPSPEDIDRIAKVLGIDAGEFFSLTSDQIRHTDPTTMPPTVTTGRSDETPVVAALRAIIDSPLTSHAAAEAIAALIGRPSAVPASDESGSVRFSRKPVSRSK